MKLGRITNRNLRDLLDGPFDEMVAIHLVYRGRKLTRRIPRYQLLASMRVKRSDVEAYDKRMQAK